MKHLLPENIFWRLLLAICKQCKAIIQRISLLYRKDSLCKDDVTITPSWTSLLNRVLGVLACLHASVLTCLRGYVLGVLTCLRAYVLAWLRAYMLACLACLACLRVWRACILGVLAGVRACYDEMFYFLTCLHAWCAFLSYLLYISILTFKNSDSEKFVCFVKLNIFLIYILIPTYKTIWNQFKGSRKVNRYII